MSADEPTEDDGFADFLAAHEESLLHGTAPNAPPPPEFKERIDDALRTVAMLQQHWPLPDSRPIVDETGQVRGERYRLLCIHAAGGVGRVWVAEDVRLQRKVALKDLQPGRAGNPLFADRFLREAQITGRLQHPGVVPVYEMSAAEDGSAPFYTMRLVQGRTLTEVIAVFHQSGAASRPRSLELNALLGAFVSVCNTAAYAHSLGIVHRDIKSANVVLGEFGEVVLVDWGFAKELPAAGSNPDEGGTAWGQVVGTPAFMPPEQASARHDDIGPHSDIFGLGAVLYEILTGQPPFSGAGLREVIQKAQETAFVPPRQARPGVPRALAAVCERAMAREPTDRYATAADLARDVQRWMADEPTSAYPEPIIDHWRRWGRRHRPAMAGLAVLIGTTFIALMIGLWLTERNQARLAAQKEADRETLEGHLYVERLALAERELAAHNLSRASQLLADCPVERRGWEWGCLERLCHTDLTILRGHEGPVSGAVFCLDGTRIVSASHDHTLKIWDASTGRELQSLPGQGAVIHCVAVSPDGERVASGGWDHQARIWDVRTGRELRTVSANKDIVIRVAFVDNRRLATASGSVVSIWDTETGQELRRFERPNAAIYGLAISPDQRFLATGAGDNFIHIWDLNSGNEVLSWCGHRSPPKHLAFSPDGKLLAAGDGGTLEDEPGTVKLWEVATGRQVASLEGHTYPVYSVAFSPDGRRLVSGSQDNSIKVWDVAHGALMLTLRGHSDIVRSLSFSRDGHRLVSASADRTVRVWDASPWDAERPPGEIESPRDHGEPVLGVGFAGPSLVSISRSSSFKRWNTEGGGAQIESMVAGPRQPFFSSVVSPAGDRMALGTSSGAVLLADPMTGRRVDELIGHGAGPIKGLAFSPDGKRLATAEWRGTVRVWDVKSGRASPAFAGHTEPVVVVAFSPDGRMVASGSYDQTVRIWDAATGKELHRLTGHKSRLSAVAFLPDGQLLASASNDGRIKIWDLKTLREVRDLDAHAGTIAGLEFSPDGRYLASAGDDRAIKLWNAETWEIVATFRGHTGAVRALKFDPAGQRLATGDQDGSVRVWEVSRLWEVSR